MRKNETILIQPHRSWFSFNLKEIAEYQDLLYFFVRRDILSQYVQTFWGPWWYLIQPLLAVLVFTIVFAKIIRIPTEGIPPPLFYLCGLVIWSFFVRCLTSTASCFHQQATLLQKVYFPRLILPFSIVISQLRSFALQLFVFFVFYVFFMFEPSGWQKSHRPENLWMIPPLILQTALLAMGIGLWITALTVRYRDLQHLVGFFLQLWFYGTPVIYPSSLVSSPWKPLLAVNPMAPVVESFRQAFLGGTGVAFSHHVISILVTVVLFLSGIIVFNRIEQTFVDTI